MTRSTFSLVALVAMALAANLALAQPAGRGQGRAGRDRFGPPPNPLTEAIDADKDGTISAAEMNKAAAALKKLDRNSDGKLTSDEMGRPDRRPGGRRRAAADPSSFERPTAPKDDAEKKILSVLGDLDAKQRRGNMNVPLEDGRLLRLLTETVGAKHVVEVGTSNGYSGIWFCLALRTTGGKLTTYEIDARRASLARQNFARAGVDGLITLIEGDAHKEVTKLEAPIDVLFLDADKEGYVDYLEKLLPLVRPGGLILAHNMNGRQADPRYVDAITKNPKLETLFLHMNGAGVGVTLKKR